MKRVMLLVCLIVSAVELDWERNRIYIIVFRCVRAFGCLE